MTLHDVANLSTAPVELTGGRLLPAAGAPGTDDHVARAFEVTDHERRLVEAGALALAPPTEPDRERDRYDGMQAGELKTEADGREDLGEVVRLDGRTDLEPRAEDYRAALRAHDDAQEATA